MNGYKRHICIVFLCVLLVSTFTGAALADVIWEPSDDFYKEHAEQCEYVGRSFYANGESGYLEVFKSPNDASLGFADNGELFHVQFRYDNAGEPWGVIEFTNSGDKLLSAFQTADAKTGWVRMSDMVVKYDFVGFEEDHGADFTAYGGDYNSLLSAEKIVMWTFPGSGENSGELGEINEDFTVQHVYTDDAGAVWGFVGYWRGMRNFWICMDDPSNENLPATVAQELNFHTPVPGVVPTKSNDILTVVIICVSAAVLISAVLIFILRKKVKK